MNILKGTGASPGISMGKVLKKVEEELKIVKTLVKNIEEEVSLFKKAMDKAIEELTVVKDKAFKELGEDKAQIFEAHIMVLQDPELIGATVEKIEKENVNAGFAFKEISDSYIAIFEAMDNEYMRERAADIRDVSGRVLNAIYGIKTIDLSSLAEEVILVSRDLTPSDTATMDKAKVLGFLTDIGGRTSHTAIMARTLEIAAVVGLGNITELVSDGDYVVFNGETGEVVINPSEEIITNYKELKNSYEKEKLEMEAMKGQESVTLDGRHVELAGNIGTPKDVKGLLKNDAEGVGLYRTEFLYMDRENLPTEEEQFEAYKEVLSSTNPRPIVIRTLDIGGDKELSYLKFDKEMNPFLGYRAIRICLDRTDIFKTQLRALLRASMYGNLRIMYPMISSLEELLKANEILEETKNDLRSEGIEFSDKIEVGMMIEVPSAAIISDILASHVDFFSIGTNDLIQYTTAVDRMNENVHYLYNPFNPAVLRLIKMVIDNGQKAGIWVGMCGEMAGDKKMIPILLGMGLDEFSMSPISILPARKLIRTFTMERARKVWDDVSKLGKAEEIEAYMNEYMKNI